MSVAKTPLERLRDADIEQHLIVACLKDRAFADEIINLGIKPEDFYFSSNKNVFGCIYNIYARGEDANVEALNIEFIKNGMEEQERNNICDYLAKAEVACRNIKSVTSQASMLMELATRRNLILRLEHQRDGLLGLTPVSKVISDIMTDLKDVSGRFAMECPSHVATLSDSFREELNNCIEHKDRVNALTTGFRDLDGLVIDGFSSGGFSIVAARPSMGKTTLALSMMVNIAQRGTPVLIFSLEMAKEKLYRKMLACLGKHSQTRMKHGNIDEPEMERIEATSQQLAKLPIYIDDKGMVTTDDLWIRIKQMRSQHDIKVVFVDYIQLLHDIMGSGDDNNAANVEAVARKFKIMARDEDVHIVALSQLNRGVEHRQNKRPTMSDLRMSGGLEQNADNVMLIYRDEHYYKENSALPGIAEILLEKQRDGAVGSVLLAFAGETSSFTDIDPEQVQRFTRLRESTKARDEVKDDKEPF
jgi:replicative DNA helicase